MLSQKGKPEEGSKSLRGIKEVGRKVSEEGKSYEKKNDCWCGERFETEVRELWRKQGEWEENVVMEG